MRRGLLLLLVLMFLTASETSALAKEVQHGKTNVSIPSTLLTVRVANNGDVTGTGSQVKISHSDPGNFCHKVKDIELTLYGQPGLHSTATSITMKSKTLNLCSFNEGDATFQIGFPAVHRNFTGALMEEWRQQCLRSGTNGSRVTTQHPEYKRDSTHDSNIIVRLNYANGDTWQMKYPVPPVILTCDACPPLVIKSNYLRLQPGSEVTVYLMDDFITGGIKPYKISADQKGLAFSGLTGRNNYQFLTGRPQVGSYDLNLTVSDSCPIAKNTVSGKIHIDVKEFDPPKLSGLSITPTNLSPGGGEVVFKVTAVDNKAVTDINSSVSRPGWSQRIYLTRISGNEKSGVWQGSYKAPVNTSRQDISYTVDFYAGDIEGNKAKISGTFVVKGDPAGSTMQKGHSIQGN